MIEFIGLCTRCGEKIFCRNGFLDGILFNKNLICFSCAELEEENEDETRLS
ncbi:hypothetical protein ACN6MY_16465 [Peribacillus sp. B-H-3]|uniref:hypothetical protein n=1 Tax=Peribacillus sp. B-H-3 TaxID=3400420 RepID=UPI003B0186E1